MGISYTPEVIKILTRSWKELVIVMKKILAAFMTAVFCAGTAMTAEAAPKPVDKQAVVQQIKKKDKLLGRHDPKDHQIEIKHQKPERHRLKPKPFHRPPSGPWHFHWSMPGRFHQPPPPPPPPGHFHRPPHRPGPGSFSRCQTKEDKPKSLSSFCLAPNRHDKIHQFNRWF